ncbi:hypothetical protein PV371_38460 [Streptomyces sp. TX20-6-3]|uniref:hypothetical protein n=1 Tax=Streptomyces sp. TX20-6-3 TaxID=3028705 RepID=UPI00299FBB78|nr:hypothetical protein [Streptomyces sp. TX20-6-3]MDX2565416.1 hypothetical protein [Streptomyces sp. TX20-6-3]
MADQLHEADSKSGGRGYGSAVVSAEKRQLDVFWKGSPSKDVVRILEMAPRNISVKMHPAAYSLNELQRAARKLVNRHGIGGSGVIRAYPREDSSGLDVVSAGGKRGIETVDAFGGAKIPVRYKDESTFKPASDRQNDSSPYKGGSAWYSGGQCSTGFSVTVGVKSMMLSAAHCSVQGGMVRFGSLDDPIVGKVAAMAPSLDLALLDVPSTPRIYRHMVDSPWSSPVRATAGTHVGDIVCTGGSRSGENCNLKVWAVEISEGELDHMVAAYHVDGKTAVARGDSGGPVFTPCAGSDCSGVTAKGIISQAGGGIPCKPGLPAGTQCSNVVGFQSTKFVFAAFNAKIGTTK